MRFTDQLLYTSRNAPRSNYSEPQRSSLPVAVPSPPYGQASREAEYRAYNQQDQPSELPQRSQVPPTHQGPPAHPGPPPQPGPLAQQGPATQRSPATQSPATQSSPTIQQGSTVQQQHAQQPPSPRKSMFDFVSPFDHLSSSSSSIKKKPVPVQISSGNEDISSWTSVSDPKRQSVDNLLENLTRGQPPSQPPLSQQPSAYDSFLSGGEFSQGEKMQSRVPPPPLPPKPIPNRTSSPRSSPPKAQAQRPPFRPAESPASQHSTLPGSQQAGTRREKENSPGPRGFRSKAPPGPSKFAKNQSSPRCAAALSSSRFWAEFSPILVHRPRPSSLTFLSSWMIFKPLVIP
jgi:hypothetical protein